MAYEQTKQPELRDRLTGALIGLARATEGNEYLLTDATEILTAQALWAISPDGDANADALCGLLERVYAEKQRLVPECSRCAAPCGRTDDYDLQKLQLLGAVRRTLKMRILTAACELAGCICRAAQENRRETTCGFLYKALFAVGMDDWTEAELLPILAEAEQINQRLA